MKKETNKNAIYEATDFFFILSELEDEEMALRSFQNALSDTPHVDDIERYAQLFTESFVNGLKDEAICFVFRHNTKLMEMLTKK